MMTTGLGLRRATETGQITALLGLTLQGPRLQRKRCATLTATAQVRTKL
jgi:hypothetical protein